MTSGRSRPADRHEVATSVRLGERRVDLFPLRVRGVERLLRRGVLLAERRERVVVGAEASDGNGIAQLVELALQLADVALDPFQLALQPRRRLGARAFGSRDGGGCDWLGGFDFDSLGRSPSSQVLSARAFCRCASE